MDLLPNSDHLPSTGRRPSRASYRVEDALRIVVLGSRLVTDSCCFHTISVIAGGPEPPGPMAGRHAAARSPSPWFHEISRFRCHRNQPISWKSGTAERRAGRERCAACPKGSGAGGPTPSPTAPDIAWPSKRFRIGTNHSESGPLRLAGRGYCLQPRFLRSVGRCVEAESARSVCVGT